MLKELKEKVCQANIELKRSGIVIYTWGNVSEIDLESRLVVIKPSGVSYDKMTPRDMVIVDLSGEIVEGDLNPSSDLPTHLYLYNQFPKIGGITHTHSINATAFAQAGVNIPILGTTHADYFYGEILCTRELSKDEVNDRYEYNTGKVIAESLRKLDDPLSLPGVLVKSHGPFTWGKDCFESVRNAVVLETIADMALKTSLISTQVKNIPNYILNKHYYRKHGSNAYYGQNLSAKK